MTPLTGTVVVRSDERDAVVKIDGRPFGFTPAVVQGIPVGKRTVTVEGSADIAPSSASSTSRTTSKSS
ncbi:MAG: PEGA domain-containing protein [Polyangiaceae bacterium]